MLVHQRVYRVIPPFLRTCSVHFPDLRGMKHGRLQTWRFSTQISADPSLGQGRGGAWDHRRCGTSPSSLSTVPSRSHQAAPRPYRVNIFLACFVLQLRLPGIWTWKWHALGTYVFLRKVLSEGLDINGFLWPLLQPTGTPRPHINGFLWASKSAVCQP